MEIRIADITYSSKIAHFFEENLCRQNDAIYSEEFFCKDGVWAAITRKQVLIAMDEHELVGAMRFYRRKTNDCISLYQFAINKQHRGDRILNKMLRFSNDVPVKVKCPIQSSFNRYYKKTGWSLIETDSKYNHWVFNHPVLV
ncbi:N-acetyltransferase [Chengkuizengella axinellae]|uniref:N-acetyltransferase n=1 Tax=Chengkuizengella axinellae TaxID=3064388 RepID=A0ABT9IU97_9BACL|nr:N-acetyltransferase [Chengkuizengella sp. 2205SS18-9]MDP5272898.1 N-acetyltransferase [Chengkuizengella sp. 2205SS18-9]